LEANKSGRLSLRKLPAISNPMTFLADELLTFCFAPEGWEYQPN